MNDNCGIIFDIQRFSIHDGPGIRTTVFLKGCSNGCGWCHNPESLSQSAQIQFYPKRCKSCGNCVTACENGCHFFSDVQHFFNRENCIVCGNCVKVCFSNVLSISGRIVTVEDVMQDILADVEYYRQSNGGVTISGGEPLLQHKFCKKLLEECKKEDLHTIVQTAGNYDYARIEGLLPFIDLVMYDVKAYSQSIYDEHIFGDRDVILGNLLKLSKENVPVVVRTPVIGSVNDSEQEIELIAEFLQKIGNLKEYVLLPYHNLGDVKYDALSIQRNNGYYAPDNDKMEMLKKAAQKYVNVQDYNNGGK